MKKTPLVDYSRPRSSGIIAVDLKEGDRLVDVAVTDGMSDVMLFSSAGKVIRFPESDVRSMGRVSRGVRGMRIADDERIIALIIAQEEGAILTATEYGYGKRTDLAEYRVQGRGGQGIISIQTSARNGSVVGAVQVCDEDQIMLITNGGTLVRTPVKDVSLVGRNTRVCVLSTSATMKSWSVWSGLLKTKKTPNCRWVKTKTQRQKSNFESV